MKKLPQRIAIIGLPGSGKSTFAMELGNMLNLPVHHLDLHCFTGSVRRDQDKFISIQEDLVAEDSWIIEGCSIATLPLRFRRADAVIYLDFPRLLCAWRVFKRGFSMDSNLSKSGCLGPLNWTLLVYIWNFKRDKQERIDTLVARYPHLDYYHLKNSKDMDTFLNALREHS